MQLAGIRALFPCRLAEQLSQSRVASFGLKVEIAKRVPRGRVRDGNGNGRGFPPHHLAGIDFSRGVAVMCQEGRARRLFLLLLLLLLLPHQKYHHL